VASGTVGSTKLVIRVDGARRLTEAARAGLQTRLEALVDLAWSTKNSRGLTADYAETRV
jgi:hypothetical protein